jgi:hypothetical protein
MPRSLKWPLSFRLSIQNSVHISPIYVMSVFLSLLYFFCLMIFGERVKAMKLLHM